MQGSLGIGNDLNHWAEDDFSLAARLIDWYKEVRKAVQQGQLYRLRLPSEGEWAYNEYIAGDGSQAVVFALQRSQQYGRPAPMVLLRGLNPKAIYRIKPLDQKKLTESQTEFSGAYLMGRGLNVQLGGDYDGTAIVLERVAD